MIHHIPLERINHNPWQTRQGNVNPEAIRELALDIEANGLLQTPRGRLVFKDVTPVDWDTNNLPERLLYENTVVQLAFGHNRYSAYQWLNDSRTPSAWSSIPVDIQMLSDEDMAVLAWSENERRIQHTPLERALAIQNRMGYFHWSQDQVAEKLGISRPVVANSLRLLRLPEDVQAEIQSGRLTERQAHALIPLYDVDPEMSRAHGFDTTVSLIVSKAVNGESSERLREDVSEAVRWLNSQVQPGLIESTQPVRPQSPKVNVEIKHFQEADREPVPTQEQPEPEEVETSEEPNKSPTVILEHIATGGDIRVSSTPPAPKPVAPPPPAPAPEPVPAPVPTTWEASTIDLTLSFWPQNEAGCRSVIITARLNSGAPTVIRMLQDSDIHLPPEITSIINELRN